MKLKFTAEHVELLCAAKVKSPVFYSERYGRERIVESHHVDKRDMETIRRVIGKLSLDGDVKAKAVLRKLTAAENAENADPGKKIGRLEALATALRKTLETTPRHWVFLAEENDHLLPWYVTNVDYTPAEASSRGGAIPAHTDVDLVAIKRGDRVTRCVSYHATDLPETVAELLSQKDVELATEEKIAEYEALLKRYEEECERTGTQYLGEGQGTSVGESSWRRSVAYLSKHGAPSKVVMDDEEGRDNDSNVANLSFWTGKGREADEEAAAEESMKAFLPAHPIVRVFNLSTHEVVDAHFSCFRRYEYDKTVRDKIVLPAESKALIDVLTGTAIRTMSDIVRGKAQGLILICSGEPGTGKTLTAEVYSEIAECPLYTVQCSQLGTDEKELEKHLGGALERATRWGAILLIDEADVYIHERGDSIRQNAIVGVFLRLLEYYAGILFMTTNRDTIIDDAILSRVTAHVRYDVPDNEEAIELWSVLSRQYGVENVVPKECAKAFPGISGRSVRQLLKLASIMAGRRKVRVTVELLKWAARFQDFTEREGDAK